MKKKKSQKENSGVKITRKEAIKKAGYAALTSASLLILETKAYAATSPNTMPSSPNNSSRNPRS